MRYVPYGQLEEEPNVIVDGAATASTVLTLSHWPHSGTPRWAAADLSAEMAFAYLDHPEHHVGASAVSNNHFDQDGLVGVFALVDPDASLPRRDHLVDIASAGDFGTYRDRSSARAAIAIASYADPRMSPIAGLGDLSYPDQAAVLYETLLPEVVEVADHVERFRALWEDEDAVLGASERAVERGDVRIDEVPALDLAVVTLPDRAEMTTVHRFAGVLDSPIHPFAIHRRTDRLRLLYRLGRRYELQYRYESWVQLASRRPLPRVDLTDLAARLSADERDGVWEFDGVGAITPSLRLGGADESSIAWEVFRAHVEVALAAGRPAWDPYDNPASG